MDLYLSVSHRIIDDRMEKCKNGRRVVDCAFAACIFKAQRLRQYQVGGFISGDSSSEHCIRLFSPQL